MSVVLAHLNSGEGLRLPARFQHAFDALARADPGVRIFFVISGFLITSLLLREIFETSSISLRGFYIRRIARIFPAFYVYIAAVALAMACGIAFGNWAEVACAALFLWNFAQAWWRLAPSLTVRILLSHIWTLSLEEQFYLTWPVALRKFGTTRGLRILLGIILITPLARVAAYYALPRFRGVMDMMIFDAPDTILVGSAYAIWRHSGPPPILSRLTSARWTGIFCLVLIFCAHYVLGGGFGYVMVGPSVGIAAALLIGWLLDRPVNLFGRFLESAPMIWIGVISYSLYLWQQPFLMKTPFHLAAPYGLIASFAVAIASYYLLENPARRAIRRRWVA